MKDLSKEAQDLYDKNPQWHDAIDEVRRDERTAFTPYLDNAFNCMVCFKIGDDGVVQAKPVRWV